MTDADLKESLAAAASCCGVAALLEKLSLAARAGQRRFIAFSFGSKATERLRELASGITQPNTRPKGSNCAARAACLGSNEVTMQMPPQV